MPDASVAVLVGKYSDPTRCANSNRLDNSLVTEKSTWIGNRNGDGVQGMTRISFYLEKDLSRHTRAGFVLDGVPSGRPGSSGISSSADGTDRIEPGPGLDQPISKNLRRNDQDFWSASKKYYEIGTK